MDKFEIWKIYGKLDTNKRQEIRDYFKNQLIDKGIARPGSISIVNEIVDYYDKNGNWDFNS